MRIDSPLVAQHRENILPCALRSTRGAIGLCKPLCIYNPTSKCIRMLECIPSTLLGPALTAQASRKDGLETLPPKPVLACPQRHKAVRSVLPVTQRTRLQRAGCVCGARVEHQAKWRETYLALFVRGPRPDRCRPPVALRAQ
jgi:hypothetical protein